MGLQIIHQPLFGNCYMRTPHWSLKAGNTLRVELSPNDVAKLRANGSAVLEPTKPRAFVNTVTALIHALNA
jgi:hypothetical protein